MHSHQNGPAVRGNIFHPDAFDAPVIVRKEFEERLAVESDVFVVHPEVIEFRLRALFSTAELPQRRRARFGWSESELLFDFCIRDTPRITAKIESFGARKNSP